MHHYFAYGSNMNPQRVDSRGLNVDLPRGARLSGYRLTFNKMSADHTGVGHANIEFSPNHHVEGVLYELAEPAEILKMDPFERAPWNYGRDLVQVQSLSDPDQITWAWTYFANPAVLVTGLRPSTEYLAHLLAGHPFLTEGYVQHLASWGERSGP